MNCFLYYFIISNEVNRRLEGDTNLGVVGIDSRIKEWGKTVFMVTAISQNGVFDTVSVLIMNYNIYKAVLIVRHSANNKLYLYDIMNIKKETSNPLWT